MSFKQDKGENKMNNKEKIFSSINDFLLKRGELNVSDNLPLFIEEIMGNLMYNTPNVISHQYKIPIELVDMVNELLRLRLTKIDEITFTLFLKREDFNYYDYEYLEPRNMFYILEDMLGKMTIQEVAKDQNLPLIIVKKVTELLRY